MNDLTILDDSSNVEMSNLEHQIKIARENPRDWHLIVKEVEDLATTSKEIAEGCFYTLPRAGKNIEGPSVRFSELILASLNNIRIGSRIAEITKETITGETIIYDMQQNKQYTVRETKSIINNKGQRYTPDMIMTTGKAAIAVSKRNVIFQASPMVQFEEVLRKVKLISTGASNPKSEEGKPLEPIDVRRGNALKYFKNLGVTEDRILSTLGITTSKDIDEDLLVVLMGLRTSIKEDQISIKDAFPPTPKEENKEKADGVKDELKKNL